MNICVLIPVHNEIKQIGCLVGKIRKKGLDVVVVDDGSSDQSGAAARENGAVVLTQVTKQGKGRSLQAGFAYVLQKDYSGVITMDGDGQHDPDDLEAFLTEVEKHPHTVITGNRMKDVRHMPFVRVVTNRFMSRIISRICRQMIPDTQCGYRYISRHILERLRLTSSDFEIETEVLIQACRFGYPVFSLPVRTIYQDEKSKINPFKDTVRFFVYLAKESRPHR